MSVDSSVSSRSHFQQLTPVALAMGLALLLALAAALPVHAQVRESIFDRVIHLEPQVITEIPDFPRWEERLGIQGRRISVGDAELWVEEEGSGVPLVLINGGPGGTHHGFHPWFSRAAEFARVVYYDQRGCGLSDYRPGPDGYSVEQAVEDLEALRKALGGEKFVLLGFSYGGFLAQYYTTRYPENVAGLVLVGASPGAGMDLGRSRQRDFISAEELDRQRTYSRQLQEMAPEKGWTDAELLALIVYNNHINGDWKRQNYYKPTPEEFAHGARFEWVHDGSFNSLMSQSAGRINMRHAFESSPIPTLILEGEWDLTWGEEKRRALAANQPNGEMVVFEKSGHSIYNEEPDAFFSILRRFMERLEPVDPDALAVFRADVTQWYQELVASPQFLLRAVDWGRRASMQLAAEYGAGWLDRMEGYRDYLRLGFALYDAERYQDGLAVFTRFEEWAKETGQDNRRALATLWQGHLLDLLGRREEALTRYRTVAELEMDDVWSHDQYGLRYALSPYAAERLETPFVRIENRSR